MYGNHNYVGRRKNALLIQIEVEIVWDNKCARKTSDGKPPQMLDNVDSTNERMNERTNKPSNQSILGRLSGVDDIGTNLTREREPSIEIIERNL